MLACAVAGAWRLGFSPPPQGIRGDFARLPGRASSLCSSLDAASSSGSPRVGSDTMSCASCALAPHPAATTAKDSDGGVFTPSGFRPS